MSKRPYKRSAEGEAWMREPWTCPKCGKAMKRAGKGSHYAYCSREHWPVFMSKVNQTEECWLWTGALQRDGYAHFGLRGKTISAHRYAYEKLVGPIPDGMDLLHSCDNRACVNPEHMAPGTHQENMDDMALKGRAGARGEKSIHAKLTDDKVREIRRRFVRTHARKTNADELAREFGVVVGVIHGIARGKSWRHVQ